MCQHTLYCVHDDVFLFWVANSSPSKEVQILLRDRNVTA